MNRIVFVSTVHPYRGGIAAFNEMLAKYLIDFGAKVKIITFTLQYPSFLFPGKSQYTSSPAPEGLDISREVNSINPFNWIKVGLKLRRERPDVIFLRYWSPYLAPALSTIARIAKGQESRVVALADNIISHEPHFYDKILTSYFVGCVDEFIVMSREVERDLYKFTTTKKVMFHPHPIYENYGERVSKEVACQKLGLDLSCRYALFFGFVRDYKGLDILLDAWAEVFKRGELTNLKLIVAGEYYTDKQKYMQQIESLGIKDRVIIVDEFVDDSDVKYYFSACDGVVQPYKTATQSGVTQIAYNFNTPMIVTDVGGLSEIVLDGKSGYVVKPDSASVAKAIIELFSGENSEMIARNIPEIKERFSWANFVKLLGC